MSMAVLFLALLAGACLASLVATAPLQASRLLPPHPSTGVQAADVSTRTFTDESGHGSTDTNGQISGDTQRHESMMTPDTHASTETRRYAAIDTSSTSDSTDASINLSTDTPRDPEMSTEALTHASRRDTAEQTEEHMATGTSTESRPAGTSELPQVSVSLKKEERKERALEDVKLVVSKEPKLLSKLFAKEVENTEALPLDIKVNLYALKAAGRKELAPEARKDVDALMAETPEERAQDALEFARLYRLQRRSIVDPSLTLPTRSLCGFNTTFVCVPTRRPYCLPETVCTTSPPAVQCAPGTPAIQTTNVCELIWVTIDVEKQVPSTVNGATSMVWTHGQAKVSVGCTLAQRQSTASAGGNGGGTGGVTATRD